MNIDDLIQRTIKSLSENSEKKIRAKVGRGNIKKYIREGKARSENDPQSLLSDLGVGISDLKDDTASGGSFRDKVAYLVGTSIRTNEAMAIAFTGVQYNEGSESMIVRTDPSFINARDGALFINNILRAAQNANAITIDEDIDITPGNSNSVDIKFIPLD